MTSSLLNISRDYYRSRGRDNRSLPDEAKFIRSNLKRTDVNGNTKISNIRRSFQGDQGKLDEQKENPRRSIIESCNNNNNEIKERRNFLNNRKNIDEIKAKRNFRSIPRNNSDELKTKRIFQDNRNSFGEINKAIRIFDDTYNQTGDQNTRQTHQGTRDNINGKIINIYRNSLEVNKSPVENKDVISPKASLLKYEVRKFVEPGQQTFEVGVQHRPEATLSKTVNSTIPIARFTSDRKSEIMPSAECSFCIQFKEKIKKLEEKLETEERVNEEQFLEMEHKFEESIKNKEDITKNIKKLQKDIKRSENNLAEEQIQTRRLGIKLEDANYEIGRLRQELINSQLENEKIVEENEDLAVDNEDLIKEQDEIIQIYDELFRESERLKLEVQIWKNVFESNKGILPESVTEDIQDKQDQNKPDISSDEDENEGAVMEIEEDQSLLLPPHHDVTMKTMDPSKVFEILEEIGRGKFGKVYKAAAKSTGDIYAAKYIKVTSKLRQDVLNTVEIMKKIHHVRLMNLFDIYDLGAQIIIIQEYVGGGSLFERIIEKNNLTEADCVCYIKQTLQGVHHMHSKNIAHLELKPDNIKCINRQSMDIKLIDFGLAKQLEHKKDIKITAGSPEFVAPEILSFDPVSLASDMWSIGVITYVLLSGISPFIGDDDNDTLINVSCGDFEYDENAFKGISDNVKDFINMLLVSNPKKRGTVSACLYHPWMKITHQGKQTQIALDRMKKFLEKSKEKTNVSAGRAIRRFSSFGVGHGLLNSRQNPGLRSGSPSKLLTVPSAMQAMPITEDDEEESPQEMIINGPIITITRDSHDSCQMNERSQSNSCEDISIEVTEDTSTADGLRSYLQRMINEGHLPGRDSDTP